MAPAHSPDGELARRCAEVIPYFPYKKIERFYDISGILQHPHLFDQMCDAIAEQGRAAGITKVVGFEARGFLFVPVAIKLGVPFVMLRKTGKMPNTVSSRPYSKEYAGVDVMCIQRDAVRAGDRVMLVDDLVATGGTLCARPKPRPIRPCPAPRPIRAGAPASSSCAASALR